MKKTGVRGQRSGSREQGAGSREQPIEDRRQVAAGFSLRTSNSKLKTKPSNDSIGGQNLKLMFMRGC